MLLLFWASLALISLVVTLEALKNCRREKFYQDTFLLFPLGIYVWGDALVLGPFWLAVAVSGFFVPLIWLGRLTLLFFALRSLYEVIYWINHQVSARSYRPPLGRHLKWLGANEAAIVYQVAHTCLAAVWLLLLLASWSW